MERRSHLPQSASPWESNDGARGHHNVNARTLTSGNVSPFRDPVDPKGDSEDPRKNRRISGGGEHRVDRSPLHSRQQTRSTHGFGTPGRSKSKPEVDVGSAVPKLTDLDENDPTSADDLTGIFARVRDERKQGLKPPMISTEPEFDFDRKPGRTSGSGCSCFSWFRK